MSGLSKSVVTSLLDQDEQEMTRTAISSAASGFRDPRPTRLFFLFWLPPPRRSALEFRRMHSTRRGKLSSSRDAMCKPSCCTRAARCQRRQFHSSRLESYVPPSSIRVSQFRRDRTDFMEEDVRRWRKMERPFQRVSGECVCIGPTGVRVRKGAQVT